MRPQRVVVVCLAVGLVGVMVAVAGAAAKLPAAGSAKQVAALVKASSSIEKLPASFVPPLTDASKDSAGWYYGVASRTCTTVTKCVFGDTKSKTSIVLFGDSHAQMWLTALVPIARSAHDRLVLVWRPGCPPGDITVWDAATHTNDTGCNSFRTSAIAGIKKLAPKLVLLADRTSDVPGAGNVLTSNAAWQAGLESTIATLKSPATKVAVIGDVTAFTVTLPDCLAAYPTAVQNCSAPNPNPQTHQHFQAEMNAAAAEGVPYINPQPWLCTTTCSPVIGTMVAYYDRFHISATYAAYLSGVLGTALKGLVSS